MWKMTLMESRFDSGVAYLPFAFLYRTTWLIVRSDWSIRTKTYLKSRARPVVRGYALPFDDSIEDRLERLMRLNSHSSVIGQDQIAITQINDLRTSPRQEIDFHLMVASEKYRVKHGS
jgi:hypothetical protein